MASLEAIQLIEEKRMKGILTLDEARDVLATITAGDKDRNFEEEDVQAAMFALAHISHAAVRDACYSVLQSRGDLESMPRDLVQAEKEYEELRSRYATLMSLNEPGRIQRPIRDVIPNYTQSLIIQGRDRLIQFGFEAFRVDPETFINTCFSQLNQYPPTGQQS